MVSSTSPLFLILSISLCLSDAASIAMELKSYETIKLRSVTGPESLAFDASGNGPYTGVSDGRVLKWQSSSQKWVQFAVPAADRNGKLCDGLSGDKLEDRCGRPLGLKFNTKTGDLYIADAYYGLMVVGGGGGVAETVSGGSKETSFFFANGVDVDEETGLVYFTRTSTQFKRRDWLVAIAVEDSTGSFMRYDPKTKKTEVLGRDLQFPNGVALSEDGRFVVVAETTRKRLLKYWLKGARKGKMEVFARLPGFPDNVKRNLKGEFWVAVSSLPKGVIGVKLDAKGRMLGLLKYQKSSGSVSEVLENHGTLWLGSVETDFVATCNL